MALPESTAPPAGSAVQVDGRDHEASSATDGADPEVSVVLPTYERASVLGGAIESVLDQSRGDLELLVVDGGSTDGTQSVVESVSDPRMRYHRRAEPAGASAARNVGIRKTDGEFVAFVDSDDRWHPDKLRRQVAALRERDCAVAYSGVEKPFGEPRTRDGASGDAEAAVRNMAVPTYTSTLLVRREALVAVGGFDEALPCFEDWDLCLRLAADHQFAYCKGPLVEKGTADEHLSADPDRLATAVERLRAKHDLPDGTLARLLADVGVTHCEAGRLGEGRAYVRRALRLDPRRPATAAAYLLSLPGSPGAFDAGMDAVYALERRLA